MRGDLHALRTQISEHHQSQQSLLRELAGIMHTVSSAFAAANQITSSEREHLLSRLENIYLALSQDRRDINETLRRLEQLVNDVGNDVQAIQDERKRSVELFIEQHEQFMKAMETLNPQILEMRAHLRSMRQKDETTGADLPMSEKILKALFKAFWAALATATIILFLSKVVVPWVVGTKPPDLVPPAETQKLPAAEKPTS
jgi:chromosome segregation ATPase